MSRHHIGVVLQDKASEPEDKNKIGLPVLLFFRVQFHFHSPATSTLSATIAMGEVQGIGELQNKESMIAFPRVGDYPAALSAAAWVLCPSVTTLGVAASPGSHPAPPHARQNLPKSLAAHRTSPTTPIYPPTMPRQNNPPRDRNSVQRVLR